MKNIELIDKHQGNDQALAILDILENTEESICIYGGAGTGKSTLIETIDKCISKTCALIAPTGVAAKNIGGFTIHSFFNIPLDMELPDKNRIEKITFSEISWASIASSSVFIIDEVSMLSPGLLDSVDCVLRRFHKRDRPFGGCQMVFIGDPYQLPPIINLSTHPEYNSIYNGHYFFNSNAFRELNPLVVELTYNYRQNDTSFIEVLNSIRVGSKITYAINKLNRECLTAQDIETLPITLASNNRTADEINNTKLNLINEPSYVYNAVIDGKYARLSETSIEQQLVLKKGAQVMFIKNDQEKRFVNGTIGIVEDCTLNSIKVIVDQNIIEVKQETWVWRYRTKRYFNGKEKVYEDISSVRQYPLRLAWAITIHKSQGLTFDRLHFNNTGRIFAAGQLYVALSRCRSIQGLSLSQKINYSDVIINKEVEKYYKMAIADQRYINILESIYRETDDNRFLCFLKYETC